MAVAALQYASVVAFVAIRALPAGDWFATRDRRKRLASGQCSLVNPSRRVSTKTHGDSASRPVLLQPIESGTEPKAYVFSGWQRSLRAQSGCRGGAGGVGEANSLVQCFIVGQANS